MDPIGRAVEYLKSTDGVAIAEAARKFSVNRSTLSKRYHGKTRSKAKAMELRRMAGKSYWDPQTASSKLRTIFMKARIGDESEKKETIVTLGAALIGITSRCASAARQRKVLRAKLAKLKAENRKIDEEIHKRLKKRAEVTGEYVPPQPR